ncbi:sensor histidine kinase [Cohnella hashimotonis]|uniref:Oxygen sensor histidine kinase NreB n=1 Tax=Cohnella hashimotonis TaxID=2826895 RepID=A0ABT6TJB8_9BACL|nr:sensor histidine kinase [Cohnella hashimotonis]MDI4646820.1 sensor histidine kinase [Cohnella hashimotonis]
MKQKSGQARNGPPLYFSLIWLVYLIFPLETILSMPAAQMIPSLLLLGLFVGTYLYSFKAPRFRFTAALLLLAMVGVFCWLYGENFVFLTFYPSPLVGTLNVRWKRFAGMGAMLALLGAVAVYFGLYENETDIFQYLPAMLIMLTVPFGMQLTRRSNELKNKLSLANDEIARLSKSEERQRISRDLHDTLGHTLSLITLKSELAERLIAKNPERAAAEIRDVQNTSRAALKQLRELVSGMNAATTREETSHASQLLQAAGIRLQVRGEDRLADLPPLVDNMMAMCLREAVTNAVKHSGASSCRISWAKDDSGIVMTVSDDGRGCPPDDKREKAGGSGLRGMRERLRLIEGELEWRSEAGAGTQLTIKLPLVEKTKDEEATGI